MEWGGGELANQILAWKFPSVQGMFWGKFGEEFGERLGEWHSDWWKFSIWKGVMGTKKSDSTMQISIDVSGNGRERFGEGFGKDLHVVLTRILHV